MTFLLSWYIDAKKFVNGLPRLEAERIFNKFDDIKENPFRYAKHYEGPSFKIRIGHYRALIDIDVKNNIIEIQYIEKRENAY